MYIGTHAAPQKRRSGKKPLLLLVSLVLVLALSIGGTLAWLTSQAEVTNTFEPGKLGAVIKEDFDGTVKTSITVQNDLKGEEDANVDAYIRAAVVINCVDENGNIIAGTIPELDYNNTDWVKGSDGYYYYKHVVAPMGTTNNLLDGSFSLNGEGVNYRVDVLAQAIQTVGGAVEDAWHMSYSNGTWAPTA